MTQPGTPAPVGGADLHYRQALDQGRFLIQRCTSCDRAIFYPRMVCPHCGAGEQQLAWEQPSGHGTVYSTTVVRRKPEAGGDYNVALIDLAEGVRLMSRVEGIAPAEVRIGMAVQTKIVTQDGGPLVVFTPEGGRHDGFR
ncbi:MAG: Zn-ribbon domain-containing OB-fold protein [Burkholderiaceae bacterium]|nr:Zn-ribbon domain-containing OB-fold protein [Burkholderiaceae bacterium]